MGENIKAKTVTSWEEARKIRKKTSDRKEFAVEIEIFTMINKKDFTNSIPQRKYVENSPAISSPEEENYIFALLFRHCRISV